MPLKRYIFLLLIIFCGLAFGQMEVLGKVPSSDEIFDVKIVAGYAFLYGMHGIYAVDLTKEEITIGKIIDFSGNDLLGRLTLSGQWLVTTFNRNGANYLTVYDLPSLDQPLLAYEIERTYNSLEPEREFERFSLVNFFVDGTSLYYIDKLYEPYLYEMKSQSLCELSDYADRGYLKIKNNKIYAGRHAWLYGQLGCNSFEVNYLEYLVGPISFLIMPDSNGLMQKYQDHVIGGTIALYADPPGVASQNMGFKVYDTSRVEEGYLVLINFFGYQWAFLGQEGWAVDGEKELYDIQEMLVKNGYLYLSSYFTCSIVGFDLTRPWTEPGAGPRAEFTILHEKADCYCAMPEDCHMTNHPFGLAAANNRLYVADKDYLYVLRLAREDDARPEGRVTAWPEVWEGCVRLMGWANDSEGIKNVAVRIGRRQFFAEPQEGARSHSRPVALKYRWQADIDLDLFAPGDYEMKVIVEDNDGDFSMIEEKIISIGHVVKNLSQIPRK